MDFYSDANYGYNRGYYGYKAENLDIKTRYYVEYTTDKKVLDMMDTSKFSFDMLCRKDFDYLEDAVSFWNRLYYDEAILHVMLYEEVILNGETVLEQCKDMIVPSVLVKISFQRIKQAENAMNAYKMENERMKKFLADHGISADKITEGKSVKHEGNIQRNGNSIYIQ